jgi:hypothetical protein
MNLAKAPVPSELAAPRQMKPTRRNPARTMAAASRILLPAAAIAAVLWGAAAASADGQDSSALKSDVSRAAVTQMPAYTVDEAASTKTHTLFMGADIAISFDHDTYGVQDVFGSNWVVEINGHRKEISAKQAPMNLKITPTLKLTESSAIIVGYRKVPAYSYENDPSVRLTKSMTKSASMSADLQAVAENAQYRLDTAASNNMSGASLFVGADDQFSSNAMQLTAQYSYSDLHSNKVDSAGYPVAAGTAPTATSNTTGFGKGETSDKFMAEGLAQQNVAIAGRQAENGGEPAGRIATMGLDAMDIEFDIRSAKPLNDPYVVTMAKFHPGGAKPGVVQNLVYAESLHPIDEHLSHVHFVEPGFPFNYELIDFQLHIYDRGQEIATNIAANRVELTREEAFEYVKMEYLGAHMKDTLPASPAMGRLPGDLHALLAAGAYAQAFYVRVSPDGLADAAYSDPACTRRIDDAYLDSVVKRIRFKPALDKGKPVDGVATIRLGQLKI